LSDNSEDRILLPLLTKASAWKYESEYRLIAQEKRHALTYDSLLTEDNFLTIPAGSLRGIILGYQVPAKTASDIKGLIKTSGSGIELGRAVPHRNRYSLALIAESV
jgi:hypothetical protein